MTFKRSIVITSLLAALAAWPVGCNLGEKGEGFFSPKPDSPEPTPEEVADARNLDPLFRDTVGFHTLYSGASGLSVRGFGLVVGLGKNGSGDCPTAVRDYLIDFMSREFAPNGAQRGRFSPAQLVDSEDTAAVEIIGMIPPGARKGAVFDLKVEALPGSSTRSLEGGLLLPCELRMFDVRAAGAGMVQGRVYARGNGPVFVSPFLRSGSATSDRNPRSGFVLGGGRSLDDRNIQLQLIEPSYPLARRIERSINERFGQRPATAQALSQGFLVLTTPREYRYDTERFLRVTPYCTMQNEGGFEERKLRELTELARSKPGELQRISLAWEAIGAAAVPTLQSLYGDVSDPVTYYAARAGLRLGDSTALGILGQIARQPAGTFSTQAIQEIAASQFQYAGDQIVPLLNHSETGVRVAAYEALNKMGHPALRRRLFASIADPKQMNLIFDEVQSDGPPLIYFRRTREPRLAVFGRSLRVATPIFYSSADERVTITASERSGKLIVFARGRTTGKLGEKIEVPADLTSLIPALADVPKFDNAKRLRGCGLFYSEVVQVLADLIDQGFVNAAMIPEQRDITELLGPLPIPERAASDQALEQRVSPRPTTDPGDDDVETYDLTKPRGDAERGESQRPPAKRDPIESLWDD